MRADLCICAHIPRIETQTRVIVIMHQRETYTTTNTGRLAHLALTNSEIRIRGNKEKPLETRGLVAEDRHTLLLYPSEDAEQLNLDFLARNLGPFQLLVPDGTWRQAHKVMNRVPELAPVSGKVTRVKLDIHQVLDQPTSYHLRQKPHAQSLSTIEAIARALGVLESSTVQMQLENVFKTLVRRTLWTRGRIPGISAQEILS